MENVGGMSSKSPLNISLKPSKIIEIFAEP
jgi:hypothetical protein